MSADSWVICPRCYRKHLKEIEQAEANLTRSYGVVAPQTFMLASEALDRMKAEEFDPSFAEYYELGMGKTGEFTISYGGGCRNDGCGFKFDHKYTKDVPNVER